MADGAFLIDSGINTKGIEKGVELIKKGVKGAADGAERMQKSINNAFAAAQEAPKVKLDKITNQMESVVAKMENAYKRIGKLKFNQGQLKDIIRGFGYGPGEVLPNEAETAKELLAKTTEKIKQEQGSISELEKQYQTLAKEREKAAKEIEKAAQRQTRTEQKEAAKQEKIAEKQQKTAIKQQTALSKSVGRFGVRLRGIIGSALIFNIISSGLRSMTQYFGNALKANDDFSKALSQLKGALLTAFQPIYNAVAPALTYLVQLATMAVEAIALLFATLSGTTLEESKKAAENLYEQANGYKAAGNAAKKAGKQIAAFDEVQKLNNETASGGGGGSSGTPKPNFTFDALPSELEHIIETLSFIIENTFFNWSNFKKGDIAQKIVDGMNILGGAAIGWSLAGPGGALVGAFAGVALSILIKEIVPEVEWGNVENSFLGFFGAIGAAFSGDQEGFEQNFNLAWDGFINADFWSGEGRTADRLMGYLGIDYQETRRMLQQYFGEGGTYISLLQEVVINFGRMIREIFPGGLLGAIIGAIFGTEVEEGKPTLSGQWEEMMFEPNNQLHRLVFGAQTLRQALELLQKVIEKLPEIIMKAWGDLGKWVYTNIIEPIMKHWVALWAATELIWGTIGAIINGEWASVEETWAPVATWFDENVIQPVAEFFATLWGNAPGEATKAWDGIKSVFEKVGAFFSDTFGDAWQAVVDVFSDGGDIFTNIQDGIVAAFKSIVNKLIAGINSVVTKPFSGINTALRKIKGIDILGIKPFSGISTISVPSIPYLAQGAVLPANKPFMAVVGDQRHGTNVEAPLTTIQEAVANVMDGQTSAILAGFEMSIGVQREILAAVLGIHIGDDAIVQAVSRYNSKMAVVRGY